MGWNLHPKRCTLLKINGLVEKNQNKLYFVHLIDILNDSQKDNLFDSLTILDRKFGRKQLVIIGRESNGHVGSKVEDYEDQDEIEGLESEIRKGKCQSHPEPNAQSSFQK